MADDVDVEDTVRTIKTFYRNPGAKIICPDYRIHNSRTEYILYDMN